MAMFTAVFDAGGHESDQPCLSVAGFISTADHWIEFSREWQKLLRLAGLPYYHHSEHRHRTDLLPGLLETIRRFAFARYGASVAFTTFSSLPDISRRLNAYSLCAQLCVGMTYQWARENQIPKEKVEFVFEEGDVGKGLLIKIMEQSGYPTPIFRYKKDVVTKGTMHTGFVPLQAADIVANELFRQTQTLGVDSGSIRLPYRELHAMPGHLSVVTQAMVDEYLAYLRATPELSNALWVY